MSDPFRGPIGIGLLMLAGCSAGTGERPNVLVLVADDLSCQGLGAFGGQSGFTPSIDRLAEAAVTFREAHAASTICTPSRQAFLTGRWPHSLGVTRLSTPLPPDSVTLGTVFRDAGYDTAAIGKMHWNRGADAPDFGFDLVLERRDWRASLDERELGLVERHRERWTSSWHDREGRFQGEPLGLAEERMESSWLVERTLEFLAAPRHRPFLAICSFSPPHYPLTYPASFVGRVDPAAVEAPAFDHAEQRRNVPGIDPLLPGGGVLQPDEARALRANYLRSVAWLDSRIGLLLDHLERSGLAENTIVVLWSDHGYLLGEHGLVGKKAAYREVVRVPLVLRVPGRGAVARDDLVSLVDVFPTLCELARIEPPPGLQGRSLVALIDGPGTSREHVFSELPGSWGMVRTTDWKMVLGAEPELALDQLYDLRADPGERQNLYGPERSAVVRDLVGRMHRWLASTPPDGPAAEGWLEGSPRLDAVRAALRARELDLSGAPDDD